MSSGTTVEREPLEEVVESIRRNLHAERDRTELEREAFEEFANRIIDLQPSNEPCASDSESRDLQKASGTVVLQSQPVSGPSAPDKIASVREAYEETVMSVPFYAAEYGDTYKESIREEFGPDIATAMTQSNSFTRIAKQVLLAKVEKCRTERRILIKTCDRELHSVDEAAAVLNPINEELRSFEAIQIDEQGFGTLEAHWTRLSTLKDKCEQATIARQATIHDHRTEFRQPVDAPDICAYLYDEFDTAYPILYLCTELVQRIENGRQQIERAMSTGV